MFRCNPGLERVRRVSVSWLGGERKTEPSGLSTPGSSLNYSRAKVPAWRKAQDITRK
jgi:hypothetical protein